MNRILAIGAHPDDIEFGCGGTIYKHKQNGDFVVYLCMTNTESVDGTTGKILRTAEENRQEVYSAAKVLECDQVEFLPFTDLKVPFSFEAVSGVEKIIKKYDIDTVYTHWAGDANQDHISTFKNTMAAARYVRNVYCYEQIPVPRMTENPMNINYYVDISDTFSKKIEASNCHVSQMVKYKNHGFDVENNLKILGKFRGIQAQCEYAEGFQILKQVKQW